MRLLPTSVLTFLLFVLACNLTLTATAQQCHLVRHKTAATHTILRPVVQWDLLHNSVVANTLVDTNYGSMWQWTHKHTFVRKSILQYLGAAFPSPVQGDTLGILSISLALFTQPDIFTHTASQSWLHLNCNASPTTLCVEYLESLGYWSNHLLHPLYSNGLALLNNASIENNWLDLSPNSAIWHNVQKWTPRAYFIDTNRILLAECSDTTATTTTSLVQLFNNARTFGWQDRRRFLHYTPVRIMPNICSDCVCIDSNQITLQNHSCSLCFSAQTTQSVFIRPLALSQTLPKQVVFQLTAHKYIALPGPFVVQPADAQIQCAVIATLSTANKLFDSLTFDGQQYTVGLRGVVARQSDASSITASAFPELDGVRSFWIILIALILMRRVLIPDDSLIILYTYVSAGVTNWTQRRLIPTHKSLLLTDVMLFIIFLIVSIWYLAASVEFLPPPPQNACFYFVIILSLLCVLFLCAIHCIIAHQMFSSFSSYVQHVCFESFLWILQTRHIRKTTVQHQRTSLLVANLQRCLGLIVGLTSLMYAIWWDTDDVYHWAIMCLALYAVFLVLTDASITLFFAGISAPVSMQPILIVAGVLFALAVVHIVLAVIYMILPFCLYVNAGTYTDTIVTMIAWTLVIVTAGLNLVTVNVVRERTISDLLKRQNNSSTTTLVVPSKASIFS